MKIKRKSVEPRFNLMTQKNAMTNKIVGDLIGNEKTWVLLIEHVMGQGYVSFTNKIDRYGKDNTRASLSDIKLVGRMLQAHLFDKTSAEWYANQLSAAGCYSVTIKRAA